MAKNLKRLRLPFRFVTDDHRDNCRIYLVGFMSAGKTTLGKHMAADWGWRFIDLDHMIERFSGYTIREWFRQFGETRFRNMETDVLRLTLSVHQTIVATGGGIVENRANLTWMKAHGIVLWLNPSWDKLRVRTHADTHRRPLWVSDLEAHGLWRKRLPLYAQAHKVVECDGNSPQQIRATRAALRGMILCCSQSSVTFTPTSKLYKQS